MLLCYRYLRALDDYYEQYHPEFPAIRTTVKEILQIEDDLAEVSLPPLIGRAEGVFLSRLVCLGTF